MRPTLRALGLKRLEEIPEHVPTVKWGWIVSGIGRAPLMGKGELVPGKQDEVWLHAAFSSRINAGVNTAKSFNLGKGKARFQDVEEPSRISCVPLIGIFFLRLTKSDLLRLGNSLRISLNVRWSHNPARILKTMATSVIMMQMIL